MCSEDKRRRFPEEPQHQPAGLEGKGPKALHPPTSSGRGGRVDFSSPHSSCFCFLDPSAELPHPLRRDLEQQGLDLVPHWSLGLKIPERAVVAAHTCLRLCQAPGAFSVWTAFSWQPHEGGMYVAPAPPSPPSYGGHSGKELLSNRPRGTQLQAAEVESRSGSLTPS